MKTNTSALIKLHLAVFVAGLTGLFGKLVSMPEIPFSSFTVSLTYNIEPIYSIVLAFIFFNELSELSLAFFCVIVLIIISVLLQNWMSFSTSHTK